ncbi:MAG: ketoacyl-ACP synthase III [Coriobacteriia bacterium]|nr:ketoacyl-ACP synthase III [Coriobacteriia bacterium]
MSIKIRGIGKGTPQRNVSNEELAGFLDTSNEWIVSRTGIASRFVCTDESLTDLSTTAALQAIERSGLTPYDIDLVMCTTIGGDYRTPSLACCVLERLGIQCPAFDVNAACTGFLYALDLAAAHLCRGSNKNILIISAEMMSTQTDWKDRNTCVLFGDGAAACVVSTGTALRYLKLSAQGNSSVLKIASGTGNSPFVTTKQDNTFLHMHGQEVFKFAINIVEAEMKQVLEELSMSAEDIDWFVLHQANKRIIESIRVKSKQPQEKFLCNIERHGNVSSASVPLLLFEAIEEKKIRHGDTLFITAFGAGMTWGSCVMVWE